MSQQFSIVVPLYNKEKWVRRALESVRAQTHSDFELIVVNDGSTDGSERVVAEYAQGDPRIHLINQPNSGASAARNSGIHRAKADWIAFLDADDEWEPEFLAEVARVMVSLPDDVSIIATNYEEKGKPVVHEGLPESGILDNYFGACLATGRNLVWTSACVVRARALREIGGFKFGMYGGMEDVDCWTRLALRGRVFFLSRTLAAYHRDDPDCLSFRANKRGEDLHSYAMYAATFQENRDLFRRNPMAIRYFQRRLFLHAKSLWQLGYRTYAVRHLWRMPKPLPLAGLRYMKQLMAIPVKNILRRLGATRLAACRT